MLDADQQIRFTQLWTDAQPSVSRYVASLVHDQWAVRDIVQNTSVTVLHKFSEYDESKPFLPWALGFAKFEILGHRRDSARSRLICDTEFLEHYTQKWAEITPQLSDEAVALRYCIGELSGRPQAIIKLRYGDGQTSDAIASQLNLTAANVRKILKRTREVLRRCIRNQIECHGGMG